ncbi:MAG: 2-amino-4-hydroxy-6-hydroxymethyldihydropteridine diphosphokinase [Chloroflexi bacterium]|nr:2-amino-4-hydroxy-6-hydroxymethyldihydropteridine diphosphokinase [Chloroflexota bacterium]
MAITYIALGANLSDRAATLRAAIERLGALGVVEAVSPFFDTAPVGYTEQPRFLNAVARLRTGLPPRELLRELLEIEASLGRVRTVRWGPRVIDLDLLLYDDDIIDEPDLVVPHPRLHERRFVLEPLAALAPDLAHPILKRTVSALLASGADQAG